MKVLCLSPRTVEGGEAGGEGEAFLFGWPPCQSLLAQTPGAPAATESERLSPQAKLLLRVSTHQPLAGQCLRGHSQLSGDKGASDQKGHGTGHHRFRTQPASAREDKSVPALGPSTAKLPSLPQAACTCARQALQQP